MLAAACDGARSEQQDRALEGCAEQTRGEGPAEARSGTPARGRSDIGLLDDAADVATVRQRERGGGDRERDRQAREGARGEGRMSASVQLLEEAEEPERGQPLT